MFTSFTLERLYVGSIYKLVFLGLGCSLVLLGVLFGVLAMVGLNTVSWKGQPVYGLGGLFLGPVLDALGALLLTVFIDTALVCGLWLYSKARRLTL